MSKKLTELLKIARHTVEKNAFVDAATAGAPPGGDPSGGGAPPPGGDPSGGGGAPPPGMDPSAGAPPPSGGGGGVDPTMIAQAVVQAMQSSGMGGGGGGGAGGGDGGMIKPKIDINVEIMQIKNILAKLADALGVPIPAQDMVATPEKLTAMAQGQSVASQGAGGGGSAISPISPMQGASPGMAQGGEKTSHYTGEPATDSGRMSQLSGRAAAIAQVLAQRQG